MKWTAQQETALKKMASFLDNPHAVMFRLWGEAGTGKTTLAAELRDRFDHLKFIALAYTGKAASRLRQKGWMNAGTIHSHLYIPSSKCRARINEMLARVDELEVWLQQTGDAALSPEVRAQHLQEQEELGKKIADEEEALKSPSFVLNLETDLPDYDVIVLDEVSMVGTKEGSDLAKLCADHDIKLILMGDPYQLPPVKQAAYFMGTQPDYQLTDVQRQAKDDPILWLAHKARAREPIPLGSYGQSKVVKRIPTPDHSFHPDQLAEMIECDQLLVGTNNTRVYCNAVMRKARGYTGDVEIGEKLICLANSKQGFFNGSIWYVQDVLDTDDRGRMTVSLSSDDVMEEDRVAKLWVKGLRGEEIHFTERSGAEVMVAAQAVTVHKFQGSEGRHIMILDESYTAREDAHRWLYTALTRAQERLTLVVK